MKVSRNWLDEFVRVAADHKTYADAMTLSGSKVEGVEMAGDAIANVVVGKIGAIAPHPDSDHLQVCQVDVGGGKQVQIVTGAQNVSAGDFVPAALDGARLADGTEIHNGVLRGVESQGMLCSVKELGLTIHDLPFAIEDGIFILQNDPDLVGLLTPGADIVPLLGLDDAVVEFEITPNRPDCLSVIGIARETAATFGLPLTLHTPVVQDSGGDIFSLLDVEIEDGALCPRYTARMVKNVKIAPSPKWMRDRLRTCGVRPINNIVDITNYVMLEYGQPMHAFDFSCVDGGVIHVRTARAGESITTLDGTRRALNESILCICDAKKPVGVAGVMGGANSEIVGDTAMVVFEAANFSGVSVRRAAAALGMRTDASGRFEKGLDPMNTYLGVQRACELVELLGCGEVVSGVVDVIAADRAPVALPLEADKINALLGTDIPAADMAAMLARLGFLVDSDRVTVPSWRSDVTHYSDLAEEVARLFGYDKIPATLMRGATTRGGYTEKQTAERLAGALCRGMGYCEIITYSFISPAAYDKIRLPSDSPLRRSVTLLNPLGEDTSIMRTTALASLLETLARNWNARNKSALLYELATVYRPVDGQDLADERMVLSLGGYGAGLDFFTFKGQVESLLAAMGVMDLTFAAGADAAFHPGRCAALSARGGMLGTLGQIHPLTCQNYELDAELYAAELDMTVLLASRRQNTKFQPLPRFPGVTRDIAVVCDASIPAAALADCIRRGAGGLLRSATLFDVYTGASIPPGKKSVAFALTLRADDRTLTDADADAEVTGILRCLEQSLGAVLR